MTELTPQELGTLGELHVYRVLSGAGLDVRLGGVADLVVEGAPVEVKASRRVMYKSNPTRHGYQFCLRRDGRGGLRGDVAILLCYYNDGAEPVAFVIPSAAIGNRQKIAIPGDPWTYGGRWARFYRQWENVIGGIE